MGEGALAISKFLSFQISLDYQILKKKTQKSYSSAEYLIIDVEVFFKKAALKNFGKILRSAINFTSKRSPLLVFYCKFFENFLSSCSMEQVNY